LYVERMQGASVFGGMYLYDYEYGIDNDACGMYI
jgi:hypothetical protein